MNFGQRNRGAILINARVPVSSLEISKYLSAPACAGGTWTLVLLILKSKAHDIKISIAKRDKRIKKSNVLWEAIHLFAENVLLIHSQGLYRPCPHRHLTEPSASIQAAWRKSLIRYSYFRSLTFLFIVVFVSYFKNTSRVYHELLDVFSDQSLLTKPERLRRYSHSIKPALWRAGRGLSLSGSVRDKGFQWVFGKTNSKLELIQR